MARRPKGSKAGRKKAKKKKIDKAIDVKPDDITLPKSDKDGLNIEIKSYDFLEAEYDNLEKIRLQTIEIQQDRINNFGKIIADCFKELEMGNLSDKEEKAIWNKVHNFMRLESIHGKRLCNSIDAMVGKYWNPRSGDNNPVEAVKKEYELLAKMDRNSENIDFDKFLTEKPDD